MPTTVTKIGAAPLTGDDLNALLGLYLSRLPTSKSARISVARSRRIIRFGSNTGGSDFAASWQQSLGRRGFRPSYFLQDNLRLLRTKSHARAGMLMAFGAA
jgi:hypothetical protein